MGSVSRGRVSWASRLTPGLGVVGRGEDWHPLGIMRRAIGLPSSLQSDLVSVKEGAPVRAIVVHRLVVLPVTAAVGPATTASAAIGTAVAEASAIDIAIGVGQQGFSGSTSVHDAFVGLDVLGVRGVKVADDAA